MASEIKLQALKEGVESVEVNAVRVAPGDVIARDQPLLEVQADKAALDVASPVAGRVAKVADAESVTHADIVLDRLAPPIAGRMTVTVQDLPRSPTGKVLKRELAVRLAE